MSAAMNRADTSIQSIGSQIGDLSLASFASGFSTPARNTRAASGSTAASSAPLATPSPPTAAQFTRRRLEDPTPKRRGLDEIDDTDGDVLDTPGREKKWEEGLDATPAPDRTKRGRGAAGKGSVNLTLRDQEKVRVRRMLDVIYATARFPLSMMRHGDQVYGRGNLVHDVYIL
jgi:hypothetical protein